MNDDALEVFKIISLLDISLYMVGDPRQAISYANTFANFREAINDEKVKDFKVLPFMNESYRVPQTHLNITNLYVEKNEHQESLNPLPGEVYYMYTKEKVFKDLFRDLEKGDSLIYISKKNEMFNTQVDDRGSYLPQSVIEKLKYVYNNRKYSLDIYVDMIIDHLKNEVQKKKVSTVIGQFARQEKISLEKKEFAQLCEIFEYTKNPKVEYQVLSINKVKGLEASNCLFIVDNAMAKYLFEKSNDRNKEFNKLYVALTRSSHKLYLAVHDDVLKKNTEDEVNLWFQTNGIKRFDEEKEEL